MMENQDKDIREVTQEAFQGFKVNADAFVWDNIQNELSKEERKAMVWWPYAAAATIALVLGLFFFNNTEFGNQNKVYSPVNSMAEQPKDEKSLEPQSNEISTKSIAKVSSAITNNNSNKSLANTSKRNIENVSQNTDEAPIKNNNAQQDISAPIQIAKYYNEKIEQNQSNNNLIEPNVKNSETSDNESAKPDNKLDFIADNNSSIERSPKEIEKMDTTESINVANIDLGMPVEEEDAPNKNKQKGIYLAANFGSPGVSGDDESSFFANTGSKVGSPIVSFNQDELLDYSSYEYTQRTFSTPILTSVTFNKSFGKRWGLESGISYSLLRARRESIESNIPEAELIQKEYLHYLGIPLHVNYRIMGKNKFFIFANAFMGIEKGISYKVTTTLKLTETNFSENRIVEGFKYYMGTGLSFEYRFIPIAGIYLLPGLNYYNSTADQPFDVEGNKKSGVLPNVRVGLRFHLNQ